MKDMGARLLPMGSAARFAAPVQETDDSSELIVAVAPVLRATAAPRGGALPLVAAHIDHPAVTGDVPAGALVLNVSDPQVAGDEVLAALSGRLDGSSLNLAVIPGRVAFTVTAAAGSGPMTGKVAIVTGGAQGFGFGIARELLAAGAHVALADIAVDHATEAAETLADEFGPERVFAIEVDVADEDSQTAMVEEVVIRWGGVDLFVANAGIVRAGDVLNLPLSDFDLVTDINYRGYFLGVRAVAPVMAAQHRAAPNRLFDIVEINSKSGLEGSNRNYAYSGSKFGGIGLTQSFALELAPQGIKVNAVCPGNYLDGPLWSDPEHGLFAQYLKAGKVPGAQTVADVRRHYENQVPLGRGAQPADVALAVQYLVAQQYETGQALPVTGGQTMLH